MFAFIHPFCMHRARRIILTAFVFQFQVTDSPVYWWWSLFLLCLYVHSFYIELHNSTPRPSCLEMRDWGHEDRGMHTFVKIHCHALFLLSVVADQESVAFQNPCTAFRHQSQTEANWGIAVDFCAKATRTCIIHHPKQRRGSPLLAC